MKCNRESQLFLQNAELFQGKPDDKHRNSFDRQMLYSLLATVPSGCVVTYGQLALMLGNRHFARAVGNALHNNPDGNKYPCYKVVNSRGELSSAYAFGGITEQKRRLEAEGILVENGKVDLNRYIFHFEKTQKTVQKG